jgi:hypothetical protein
MNEYNNTSSMMVDLALSHGRTFNVKSLCQVICHLVMSRDNRMPLRPKILMIGHSNGGLWVIK